MKTYIRGIMKNQLYKCMNGIMENWLYRCKGEGMKQTPTMVKVRLKPPPSHQERKRHSTQKQKRTRHEKYLCSTER